jgi:hypothetical protein
MIACAKSERMQRKLDYTQEEVRVLKYRYNDQSTNFESSFT